MIIDRKELEELEKLDGCYVLLSYLEPKDTSKDEIHARYNDLSKMEKAFRLFKTGYLEPRPVYVLIEKSTRGHILVVMLSLFIRKHLEECWRGFGLCSKLFAAAEAKLSKTIAENDCVRAYTEKRLESER